jgi:hypothetical protein
MMCFSIEMENKWRKSDVIRVKNEVIEILKN